MSERHSDAQDSSSDQRAMLAGLHPAFTPLITSLPRGTHLFAFFLPYSVIRSIELTMKRDARLSNGSVIFIHRNVDPEMSNSVYENKMVRGQV